MPKSAQELRDEADKTESQGNEKAQSLRDAAEKTEEAENAQKEAGDK